MNNGYKEVYMPTHPFCRQNGTVLEHRLMAEKKINRYLLPTEVVHHIDGNKANNNIDNLMVFKTTADHSAFHQGIKINLENDVWVAEYEEDLNICPVCSVNYKDRQAKMCIDCWNMQKRKVINRPNKEQLINLIKQYPMVQIGKMYGVSDNTIRKWCRFYNLPYKYKDIKKL